MANIFQIPKKIIAGKDALQLSKESLSTFGKKVLIVTDDVMIKLGNVKKLQDVLEEISVDYVVYSGVNGEPTDKMVEEGINVYKDNKCEFLIAIGGGSPIDTMKAIGAMITNSGDIKDYNGKIIEKEPPILVAIPTTAGTGSEATKVTIITDTKNNIKMLLQGGKLIPTLAVVDPVFTLTAPKGITAATGVDALTHAIEAYTSRKSFPLADTFAISAVKKLYDNLLRVYEDGLDIRSREIVATAATEAGIAFNNSSVTIVHGMSRPIGALFHVPHGLSNAVLLEKCLKFLKSGAVDRLVDLAKAIGVYDSKMTDEEAADKFIEAISELLERLEIPNLQALNIDKDLFFENIDKMAKDALDSGSPANTRKVVAHEDIVSIYKELWS
ncbi:MAG: iron-containing alcohol dehydrogenase [Fusobacterium sp. JB021]|nr:iron-containing alcohol dehydrogenase [Fusobacterium sp. JB020]MDP0494385.1 iron-containing alcohol dehydrogenase [Fusobacterium sp. JB021]MDP0506737.1 iron-containing alcohol dehydrogenase [Fusobacterium sp. JB019]